MEPRSRHTPVTPIVRRDQPVHQMDGELPRYRRSLGGAVQVSYFWAEKGATRSTTFIPRDTCSREEFTSMDQAIERYDPFQWSEL